MSEPLSIAQLDCRVELTVPSPAVELHTGYQPAALGQSLARQVDAYVRAHALGYYPALDYFRDQPTAVDPALLLLLDEVAAFCAAYARRELRRRLTGAFSSLRFGHIQALAYALPHARPNRPDALRALAAHLNPSRLRFDLLLGVVHKGGTEGLEEEAAGRFTHWVREPFEGFAVLSCRVVEGEGSGRF